jgi:hypothetical protein
MRARRLSVPAERQMEDLLGVRIRDYGAAHAQNYRELILIAIDGAAADPVRFGATRIPRIRAVWEYELRHSKDRAPRDQRIRSPGTSLFTARCPMARSKSSPSSAVAAISFGLGWRNFLVAKVTPMMLGPPCAG